MFALIHRIRFHERSRIDVVAYAVLNFALIDLEVVVGKDIVYPFVGPVSVINDVGVIAGAAQLTTLLIVTP